MNPRTQTRKRLICIIKNRINYVLKHVNAYYKFITNKFENQVNNLVKQTEEIHPAKK
jgi:hypothetical protein